MRFILNGENFKLVSVDTKRQLYTLKSNAGRYILLDKAKIEGIGTKPEALVIEPVEAPIAEQAQEVEG